MLLLLAILAAIAWLVFASVAVPTLFWLAFARDAEGKRRRAAIVALAALAAAIVLSAMRFIMSFS